MTEPTLYKIATWAVGNDTGASSKYLARAILGTANKNHTAIPYDMGDFGRVYGLARLIPEDDVKRGLEEAGKYVPRWNTIALHWKELVALYQKGDFTTFTARWSQLGL